MSLNNLSLNWENNDAKQKIFNIIIVSVLLMGMDYYCFLTYPKEMPSFASYQLVHDFQFVIVDGASSKAKEVPYQHDIWDSSMYTCTA